MKCLAFISLLSISIVCCKSDSIIFHSYSPTASSYYIKEWNIDTTNHRRYIKETIDSKGRVKSLEFLINNLFPESSLCYLANYLTYDYQPNKIIVSSYYDKQSKMSLECGEPWKTEYYLNGGVIIKVVNHFDYDTTFYPQWLITEAKKEFARYETIIPTDSSNLSVNGYNFSFAKLNGLYPTNATYKLKEDPYNSNRKKEYELIRSAYYKNRN